MATARGPFGVTTVASRMGAPGEMSRWLLNDFRGLSSGDGLPPMAGLIGLPAVQGHVFGVLAVAGGDGFGGLRRGRGGAGPQNEPRREGDDEAEHDYDTNARH